MKNKKEYYACLIAFEKAQEIKTKIDSKIYKSDEEKRGLIMIASQLYFYCGENGIKEILQSQKINSREEIFDKLKNPNVKSLFKSDESYKKVLLYYQAMLPVKSGGRGFRNQGAYKGINSNIFLTHKEFASLVLEELK